MGVARQIDITEKRAAFDLRTFLWRSFSLGALIALFSGPFAAYVIWVAGTVAPDMLGTPPFHILPPVDITTMDIGWRLGFLLVYAPIVESLVYPIVYWLLSWAPGRRPFFIVIMGALAYIAHGMMVVNVVQAAGFMLMAAWYDHLRNHYPSPKRLSFAKAPYCGIALAHFAWNATAILWPLAIASLVAGMENLGRS